MYSRREIDEEYVFLITNGCIEIVGKSIVVSEDTISNSLFRSFRGHGR